MTKYVKTNVSNMSGVNSELGKIATAIDSQLDTTDSISNHMMIDLDMNSNDILNVNDISTTRLVINGNIVTTSVIAFDESLDYNWTGTHTFAIKLLPSDLDLTKDYDWTGTHTYTIRTTVNGNTVYDQGNICEAVICINAQVGTSYIAVLSDNGTLVTMDNASANTFTVPPNSTTAFPIGTVLTIRQKGAGATTIVEGAGVTISVAASKSLVIAEQHEWASLVHESTDAWSIAGGLA